MKKRVLTTALGLFKGNGFGAEIHMVVRTHGPLLVGDVDSQIGYFGGGCAVNACFDQFAVAFPAVD